MRGNSDPDNDRGYRTPRAWRDLKAISRKIGNRLPDFLLGIEKIEGMCPRLALAIAAHHFMRSDASSRTVMMYDYFDWCGRNHPLEAGKFGDVVTLGLSRDLAKRVRWMLRQQEDSKYDLHQLIRDAIAAFVDDAPPAEELNEDGTEKQVLPESLPVAERDSLAAEFEAVMRRIMGEAA